MNTQAFTPEEQQKGLHYKLIEFLMKQNEDMEKCYNEIHITSDGYCIIVEWDKVPYSREYGGTFQYIDEDHVVMKEVRLPDGHYEYAFNEEDEKEIWDTFLKGNPGWVKTSYGTWTNEIENEKFKKLMENL